ncbi:hypothetical protein SAMN05444266_109355 [Chitinophaga jiangningensis]|uniref:Uncharacterized protein n=1 Tax=Chitinophaga jiangningensis TaxID=1419482 RepID=A0A1M7KIZ7_9BACT|nr:hypothetical protein [Chitinophaga jiangningensis]SHM65314.1 hypothetical protein SAMN05444266_109355 [Chitinophaga jiangningensis]
MSTQNILQPLPVGDLQFFDNYVPVLSPGNYFINVTHTLTATGATPFTAQQEFVVTAPQFAIDPTQVVNMYPAAGSTGQYGQVLPNIVLNDPSLPWERSMTVTNTPWLALLVFQDTELNPGTDTNTQSSQMAIADFLATTAPVLVPQVTVEADVDTTSSCTYINMPVSTFTAVLPYLDELPYLAHLRKVNTGNKAMAGLNENGLFSVIAANRFADAPAVGDGNPAKNIVHLVSLEGMDSYLSPDADLSTYTSVSLVSLASWTFLSLPDTSQDFKDLVTNLVNQETNADNTIDPTLLWLRLPGITSDGSASATEINNRLGDGYVPLPYHTRSGENTFAWYRGPMAPLLPVNSAAPLPYYTADQAMIFDKTFGVFDVSLATAWETGREAALSDASFAQQLFNFRNKAHQITDNLLYKLTSDHFSATDISALEATTTVQDEFLQLLTPQLIQDIGNAGGGANANEWKQSNGQTGSAKTTGNSTDNVKAYTQESAFGSAEYNKNSSANRAANTRPSAVATTVVEDTKAFLSDPGVQAQLLSMIQSDMEPVTTWLAKLMLLYPVPFHKMVADQRLLPVESLRFFYLDYNWLNAAVDGALSLGLDSSRETFFSQVTKNMIFEGALSALAVMRSVLEGETPGPTSTPPQVISGLLLRSALISGWPNLVIKAQDPGDTTLNILRMDLLSSNVLLCLFDGVPDNVEISQPAEAIGFGVDDDGNAVLRDISTGTPGAQVGTVQVYDLTGQTQCCMRSAGSRVLNITPSSANGLVQTLTAALVSNGVTPPGNTLTPGTLALQLIKSPEAVVFTSQSTQNNS